MAKWGKSSVAKAKPKQSAQPAHVPTPPVPEGIFTRRRVATVIAGLLAVQLFYTVIFGKNGVVSYIRKQRESEVLALQINRLQQENAQLKEETTRLQQDPNAIEHQAREQLHYTRPGEVIYALPASPTSQAAPKK